MSALEPFSSVNFPNSFAALNSDVFLFDPRASTTEKPHYHYSYTSPSTILLCTWADAQPCQISRYVQGYASLYPESRILVLTTSKEDLLWKRAPSYHHERLRGAVEAVITTQTSTNRDQRRDTPVLLHLFANSGALQACHFLHATRAATGRRLDTRAIIYDSAPSPELTRVELARQAASTMFSAAGAKDLLLSFAEAWTQESVARQVRQDLHDPELVEESAIRCHFHPEEDLMVSWRDDLAYGGKTPDEGKKKDVSVGVRELDGSESDEDLESVGSGLSGVTECENQDWESEKIEGEAHRMEWHLKRDMVDEGMRSEWGTVDESKYWKAIEELWA